MLIENFNLFINIIKLRDCTAAVYAATQYVFRFPLVNNYTGLEYICNTDTPVIEFLSGMLLGC